MVVVVDDDANAAIYRAGFMHADVDEYCDKYDNYAIIFTTRRMCRLCIAQYTMLRRVRSNPSVHPPIRMSVCHTGVL